MRHAIPRRTREIELWDANPIGNRSAWLREMGQFWSFMLTRGRRVRTPPYLMTKNANQAPVTSGRGSRIPAMRPITVPELASLLTDSLEASDVLSAGGHEKRALEKWFAAAALIPGERIRWLPAPPAAGLAIAHYLGLAAFNRGVTRERYWAAFFYSALRGDLDYARVSGDMQLAGPLLDQFLSLGLSFAEPLTDVSTSITWTVDEELLAASDPDLYVPVRAMLVGRAEGIPSTKDGIPDQWLAGTQKGEHYDEFLCPGMVVLLRRAIRLLLRNSELTSHVAAWELIETLLVNHAAFYYVSGMRVVNDLSAARRLPPDCRACWQRFQPDLRSNAFEQQLSRWQRGEYAPRGTAADADWVETNCSNPNQMFVNAGRKEQQEAKELARTSLENLRHQLASYTVNRIMLKVARDVANEAAGSGRPGPTSLADVYEKLDEWYEDRDTRLMLTMLWKQKVAAFIDPSDDDVPGAVKVWAEGQLNTDDPLAVEGIARHLISETILSTRAYSRYVEVLHSMLGGGALPTNQDPKGMMARGGSRTDRFHLSLNDRTLEAMVALASVEASEAQKPLSFQGFVDFLSRRYRLLVDRKPDQLNVAPGLVADAASQSREQLRVRLSSMGLLQEFSDSSDWNRVFWGGDL